jgi:DNA (cytosine-5)-methyltransferase 1
MPGYWPAFVSVDGVRVVLICDAPAPTPLAAAQGFPSAYQFAEAQGRPVPKYQQVRLIGNSVCPPLARAIVEANFTHERRFMPAPAERAAA